jgi:hypothetical protein
VPSTPSDSARSVRAVRGAEAAAETLGKNTGAARSRRRFEAASPVTAEKERSGLRYTMVRTHDGQEKKYQLPKGKVKFNQTNDQVSWAVFGGEGAAAQGVARKKVPTQ